MNYIITTKGVQGAQKFLQDFSQNIGTHISRAVDKYAENRVDEMRTRAPVQTGYLRNNIRLHKPTPTSVQINAWAPYSYYVNYGMPKGKRIPKPFFTAPLEEGIPILARILEMEISFYIRSIVGKYQHGP